MSSIFFGIIWIVLGVVYWWVTDDTFPLMVCPTIGFCILTPALIKRASNRRIEKKGIDVYGYIRAIHFGNVYVNDRPSLKAEVHFLNPQGMVDVAKIKYLGPLRGDAKYKEADWWHLKYYKGKCKFMRRLDDNEVPAVVYNTFAYDQQMLAAEISQYGNKR